MGPKRSPGRRALAGLALKRSPRTKRQKRRLLLGLAALVGLICGVALYLRSLSSSIALSDASDAVNLAVNDCVGRVMRREAYSDASFVTLEKDGAGNITAITTDTAKINLLSSELLSEITRAADNQLLNIRIPLGSLLGSNLLLGRGPEIPVKIMMLTSSFVRFDHELVSTGINQSRHRITLKTAVDVDILIPWATVSTTVETDVLISDTIIVGRIPETYVSVTEDTNGSK